MDRAAAVAYLAGEFRLLGIAASLDFLDTTAGVGPCLDSALRDLGLSVTATVGEDQVEAYKLLLQFYTLGRLSHALAARVTLSINAPTTTKAYSDLYRHCTDARASVERQMKARGVRASSFRVFRLFLDTIEPPHA